MIIVDGKILVDGSFNWFSATRTKSSRYYNWDTSIVYEGEGTEKIIKERFKSLQTMVKQSKVYTKV